MENGAQLENSSTINIKIRKHLRTIYKKMKITFILIFLITDVTSVTSAISIQDVQAVAQGVIGDVIADFNARRVIGDVIGDVNARRSSSRSTSGLNTSSKDDQSSDAKPSSTKSRRCDSFMSQEEMNSYFSSPRIINVLGNGRMPPDGIITHCLIEEHTDKKIFNQRTENPRRKPKKTKREKPKKSKKMESKDKPNIRSHTNNKSTVREVSHRNEKNLRTQLMSSKSLQTSNCNSPYKCNGFNENWFPQSNDIDLKLSLVLMISIFI